MAYTYQELQNEVRRWLEADSDAKFDASFPGFVRLAETRIYTAARIQPSRQVHTETLNANVAYFDLPENFISPISVSVAQYGDTLAPGNLMFKQADWLIEAVPVTATGRPAFYSIQNDEPRMVIAPAPALATILRMEFHGFPTSLVDTPDPGTTWVSRNAPDALLMGTLHYAYIYEKGEQDMRSAYKEDFEKALLALSVTARSLMRRDEYRASPQANPE